MSIIQYDQVPAVFIDDDGMANALFTMDEDAKKSAGLEDLSIAEILIKLHDLNEGQRIIRALGMSGSYYLKEINGKQYLIIRGHASLRPYLKGTKYLPTNPQVLRLGIGPVGLASASEKNFVISMTLYAAQDLLRYAFDDSYTLEYLAADLSYQGATTVLSIYAMELAFSLAAGGAFGAFLSMALPAVGIGLVAAAMVDYLAGSVNEDRRITDAMAAALRATAHAFRDHLIAPGQRVRDAHLKYDPDESHPALPPDDSASDEPPPNPNEPPDLSMGDRPSPTERGEWASHGHDGDGFNLYEYGTDAPPGEFHKGDDGSSNVHPESLQGSLVQASLDLMSELTGQLEYDWSRIPEPSAAHLLAVLVDTALRSKSSDKAAAEAIVAARSVLQKYYA